MGDGIEFDRWSKSSISWVASWVNCRMNSEEAELFMACWSIPSCTHGQVYSLDCNWLLVYAWVYQYIYIYIYIYITAFTLVVLPIVCCLFPGIWGTPFQGCRRGRRYFWILPDTCGLQPCVRTHFRKGSGLYLSGSGTENK